jgi:hypothetical protein
VKVLVIDDHEACEIHIVSLRKAISQKQVTALAFPILLIALVVAALLHRFWPETRERAAHEEAVPAGPKSGAGFRDMAEEVGINFRMHSLPSEKFRGNLYDHGCGLAIGDFDGDGFEDIYFLNQFGANALYRNQGDGTFLDVSRAAGVALGDRVSVSATWADYDNDGRPDLFVTSARGGNVLFRNLGNGKFKDVSSEAGVGHVGHSQTAVFFDYDNDGFLDLLVTNTAKWTKDAFDPSSRSYAGITEFWDLAGCAKEYNILYHNNRDGTFTDVAEKAGLKGQGWCGDVAVFDYDEDGRIDVLVTNMFGRTQLYRNNGNGTFTEVTAGTLGRTSWGAAGSKAFDFNNDGKLDLYIVDMHSDMWMPADATSSMIESIDERARYTAVSGLRKQFDEKNEKALADAFQIRYTEVLFGNTFFKNLGGKFEEVALKAGLETWWPWSIAVGDFDNDGWEDVFVASGMGFPYFYWPNYLLHNNGNETFTNRSHELGIEPPARGHFLEDNMGPRSSRSAAVADFDHDGRLEIVTNNFNDRPYYFKSNLPRRNYLACRLRGTQSNRDAIGAVARLYVGNQIMTRQVHPAGGYLAQSSSTLHFGLGDRHKVDRLEIRWPRGRRQTIPNPAINKQHEIVEPN